jgi:hypothetical protein
MSPYKSEDVEEGGRICEHVYVVNCVERIDRLYVFANRDRAEQFLAAVISKGGEAVLTEEPVVDDQITMQSLIETETGNE